MRPIYVYCTWGVACAGDVLFKSWTITRHLKIRLLSKNYESSERHSGLRALHCYRELWPSTRHVVAGLVLYSHSGRERNWPASVHPSLIGPLTVCCFFLTSPRNRSFLHTVDRWQHIESKFLVVSACWCRYLPTVLRAKCSPSPDTRISL